MSIYLQISLTTRGVEKFGKNFPLHFDAFIVISWIHHSRSPPFSEPFLKKPRQTDMASPRKSASQVVAATSKGKPTDAEGVGPTNAHPPRLDIHIEDVEKEHSSSATVPKAETNGHETWLPAEGKLIQMLASLSTSGSTRTRW